MIPASRGDIIAPAVLDCVVVAANAFVKAGASLDPALLEGTTLVAVKRFYAAARDVPWLDLALEATRLKERAWRCASHVAYYALQEHQRRCKVIPVITSAMQGDLLSTIREQTFPSKEFLEAARDGLKDAGLPGGCLSTVYLSNMSRHAKHLLQEGLRSSCREEIARSVEMIARDPSSIVEAVVASLATGMNGVPVEIVRTLSRKLTRRVKERIHNRGTPSGSHRLDGIISTILDGVSVASWQQARRAWRDVVIKDIETRILNIDLHVMAVGAVYDMLSRMTVEDALASMFSTRRFPRVHVTNQLVPDPTITLRDRAMMHVKNHVAVMLWKFLAPAANAVLTSISKEPERHVSLPRCKKQSITVAIDDGQVYQLQVKHDAPDSRVIEAKVRFSLEPKKIFTFFLRGLDRIDALIERGFTPVRGTITRKPGGGLLLHLPFEKQFITGQFPGVAKEGLTALTSTVIVGATDLGLKHLAWLSVGECRPSGRADGSWEPADAGKPEIARYCIDQPQLVGRKDTWWDRTARTPIPNLKRQLIATMGRARALQRQKDLLRRRFGKRYKHSWRYFVARREWQRCWRRVRHLHEEMARQVATRIVAACVHHGVELLRCEDLTWSSHSAKQESGSWLASWQVHWFFSQVQERTTRLARVACIAVELVDARGTSKRCSACGTIGNRNGKTFTCTNASCAKKVDSDLNGARNVRFASTSPRLHAKGGGARYRPLACQTATSLSLDEPNLDVHIYPGLK